MSPYVSGIPALDAEGRLVGERDAGAQTRAVLGGIRSVVEAGGGTMADIAYVTIFLSDMAHYAAMTWSTGSSSPVSRRLAGASSVAW
ncbi:RidA family protein [Dankookia sp. GCM10030260]|uniref:RidA family protein n=1 Tax=Dankookia sp. GCM10030260 TaxID=3273390 RepID=UPI003611E65D